MSTTIAPPTVAAPEDETFTIPGLTWEQYVIIGNALGDRAGLRILFQDGSLTFVSPASVHEEGEEAVDSLIKAIAVGCRVALRALGSTTLRKLGRAGLEGDRVYYLGENVERMRGVRDINMAIHPPPDLAIEVENTHQATDALVIYADLRVPEVWRYDVRRATLSFWKLGDDGVYELTASSRAFPFLNADDVLRQVLRAQEIQSYTEWVGQLNDWVRDVIRPRLDPA